MNPVTVTISLNAFFQPSEADVLLFLRGTTGMPILSVDRSLFSGRFVVVVNNLAGLSDTQILQAFFSAMQAAGYTGEILSIESGSVSSAPGGLPQVATGAASTVSSMAAPVLIPAAIIAVVVLVVLYIPRKG